jgi:hypothetical protein
MQVHVCFISVSYSWRRLTDYNEKYLVSKSRIRVPFHNIITHHDTLNIRQIIRSSEIV